MTRKLQPGRSGVSVFWLVSALLLAGIAAVVLIPSVRDRILGAKKDAMPDYVMKLAEKGISCLTKRSSWFRGIVGFLIKSCFDAIIISIFASMVNNNNNTYGA